eukprot:GHUV01009123.1.p1 GENE.GHUV01009123.1~~GHUV01009123.1.p1  ORF type:complete len:237 (+),score=33.82 GHUV01009123.1:202-912(+)
MQGSSRASCQNAPGMAPAAVHPGLTSHQRSFHRHHQACMPLQSLHKAVSVVRHKCNPRQHVQTVHAFQIDRRHHLELAWKRQQERDERLAQDVTFGKVVEIKDLEHLDSLVDKAGNSLVVVCFYTRSCGACKALLQEFQHLCEEAKAQQVRAVFARHNLLDEFDSWSDLSVWHKIRVVPTIMFYDGGAVVKKVTLHDVRRMGEAAPTIREQMQHDVKHMRTLFRQMIFEKAPGARS